MDEKAPERGFERFVAWNIASSTSVCAGVMNESNAQWGASSRF
jgi:hypothetical protein